VFDQGLTDSVMVAVDTGGRADPGPLNAIPTNPRTVPETLNATGLFFW